MTHVVDKKMRTDNIWNLAIFINNHKDTISKDDICLTTNFCYSSHNIHSFSKEELVKLYSAIV